MFPQVINEQCSLGLWRPSRDKSFTMTASILSASTATMSSSSPRRSKLMPLMLSSKDCPTMAFPCCWQTPDRSPHGSPGVHLTVIIVRKPRIEPYPHLVSPTPHNNRRRSPHQPVMVKIPWRGKQSVCARFRRRPDGHGRALSAGSQIQPAILPFMNSIFSTSILRCASDILPSRRMSSIRADIPLQLGLSAAEHF